MDVKTSILTILILILQSENTISTTKLQLDNVVLLNSTYMEGYYNLTQLHISKFNRTSYVLNFETTLYIDLDNKFDVEVLFHHNRLNNNQYNKTPFRVSKRSLCKTIDDYYTLIESTLEEVSNFPLRKPAANYCPLKKVYILFDSNYYQKYIHNKT